jgi:hypothetical protein
VTKELRRNKEKKEARENGTQLGTAPQDIGGLRKS